LHCQKAATEYQLSFVIVFNFSTSPIPDRRMPLMKISLSIIVSILTLLAHGQDTGSFKVTLTGWQGDGRHLPQLFDTVFLNRTFNKTNKIYLNVSVNDSSFVIADVPIGKYWLLFSSQFYCVSPVQVIVCSKCDNQFLFLTSPKMQGVNCNTFEMVEVSPMYIGGNKALSKDFQQTLSRAERKKLKAIGHFTVHFYLTKQGAISDPLFCALRHVTGNKEHCYERLCNS